MEIKKLTEKYEVSKNDVKVYLEVHKDSNSISIYNEYNKHFEFRKGNNFDYWNDVAECILMANKLGHELLNNLSGTFIPIIEVRVGLRIT